jgi:hypothetical protein
LHILIFRFFWQQTGRQKTLDWMVTSITRTLLISSWIKFWFVTVVPKYLNGDAFSNFQTICLLFLCPDFDLHSGDEIATYT